MADLMGKEPEEISLVFKGKMLDTSKVSRARKERSPNTKHASQLTAAPSPFIKTFKDQGVTHGGVPVVEPIFLGFVYKSEDGEGSHIYKCNPHEPARAVLPFLLTASDASFHRRMGSAGHSNARSAVGAASGGRCNGRSEMRRAPTLDNLFFCMLLLHKQSVS